MNLKYYIWIDGVKHAGENDVYCGVSYKLTLWLSAVNLQLPVGNLPGVGSSWWLIADSKSVRQYTINLTPVKTPVKQFVWE
jgi:hypothetical protein